MTRMGRPIVITSLEVGRILNQIYSLLPVKKGILEAEHKILSVYIRNQIIYSKDRKRKEKDNKEEEIIESPLLFPTLQRR